MIQNEATDTTHRIEACLSLIIITDAMTAAPWNPEFLNLIRLSLKSYPEFQKLRLVLRWELKIELPYLR